MPEISNQFCDRSKTQAVIVHLSDGSQGTFYGPLQFDESIQKDDSIKVDSVEISEAIPLANGVNWMLEGLAS